MWVTIPSFADYRGYFDVWKHLKKKVELKGSNVPNDLLST